VPHELWGRANDTWGSPLLPWEIGAFGQLVRMTAGKPTLQQHARRRQRLHAVYGLPSPLLPPTNSCLTALGSAADQPVAFTLASPHKLVLSRPQFMRDRLRIRDVQLYIRDLLTEYAALQRFTPVQSAHARCMDWQRLLLEFEWPHYSEVSCRLGRCACVSHLGASQRWSDSAPVLMRVIYCGISSASATICMGTIGTSRPEVVVLT
jgi:hypothetical protein